MAALALAVLAGCLAQDMKRTSVLRVRSTLSLSAHPAPPEDNATKSTNDTPTSAASDASADMFLVEINTTAIGTVSEYDEARKVLFGALPSASTSIAR